MVVILKSEMSMKRLRPKLESIITRRNAAVLIEDISAIDLIVLRATVSENERLISCKAEIWIPETVELEFYKYRKELTEYESMIEG